MKFTFKPTLEKIATFDGIAGIPEFAQEQAVFSGSPSYTRRESGILTRRILDSWAWDDEFIKNADSSGRYQVIDTRVQRLMPGMFPSIPGWHCDGVPREDYDAQPDLSKIDRSSQHYTALLATDLDVSNTEYVVEPIEVDIDEGSQEPIWKQVHRAVEKQRPRTAFLAPGTLYRFDQQTIHRATITKKRGWRMFFRCSLYHKKPLEKKSGAMQVYILSEENGW